MAKTNFPKSATGFNTWFTNFNKAFTANYKAWGFTQKDCRQVNQWYKSWQRSYSAWTHFNEFQKFMGQFHNFQWQACQSMIEGYWSQITKNSKFTGNAQFWFGTTAKNITVSKPVVKKTTKKAAVKKVSAKKQAVKKIAAKKPIAASKPTPKKATVKKIAAKKPAVKKIVAKKTSTKKIAAKPILAQSMTSKKPIRTSPRATTTKTVAAKAKKTVAKKPIAKRITKVTKQAKSIKTSGASNAPFVWFTSGAKKGSVNVYVGSSKNGGFKPTNGANSAYVEYRNGNGKWNRLTQGSNFPFTHTVSGNNKKIYYRACWINNGKKGSWSPAMSYTFGVKTAA